ncbi:MAG: TetR family transcriptional regulator, partial [Thermoleophilaceae bacterium]|nr:TetR family transcriptional regulator [Thermoleophilaceae bacterium]
MPRPVRERQMIEAATRAFGRHGFHGASMDEIAVEVGVS